MGDRSGGWSRAVVAQQLVALGEAVVDVPPTLSAWVRLLDSGRTDKTDAHDARSAAIVALRHARLRAVGPVDHAAVLRMLATATTTSPQLGPGRSVDSTHCCVSWSRVV